MESKLNAFIRQLCLPRRSLFDLKESEGKDFQDSKDPEDIFSDGQDQQEAITALAARELCKELGIAWD